MCVMNDGGGGDGEWDRNLRANFPTRQSLVFVFSIYDVLVDTIRRKFFLLMKKKM